MKKQLRFILAALLAFVGMNSWAQAEVQLGNVLTADEINAGGKEVVLYLPYKAAAPNDRYFQATADGTGFMSLNQNGNETLSTLSESCVFTVEKVDGGIVLKNKATGKYVAAEPKPNVAVENVADAAVFTAMNVGTDGFDSNFGNETYKGHEAIRFQKNGTSNYMNSNGPQWATGTGCWSAYVVFEVAKATEPETTGTTGKVVEFDFTTNGWGLPEGSANGLKAETEFTNGTYTIKLKSDGSSNKYYWNTDGYLLMGKTGATLTFPEFDFAVRKIEVVGTSGASETVKQNIFVGTKTVSTETTGAKNVTNTYLIDEAYQEAGIVFTLQVLSNANTQMSKIYIYENADDENTEPEPVVNEVANVAALTALAKDDLFKFTGELTVVANPTAKYLYVKDATGSTLVYNNDGGLEFEAGQTLAADWQGKVSIYNGLFEAVPTTTLAATTAEKVEVAPEAVDAAYITAEHVNQVVTLKGVTYTELSGKNFTITVGEAEVAGYNQFGLEIAAPAEGKKYDIVGVISVYNTNVQFQPLTITEVEETTEPEEPVVADYSTNYPGVTLSRKDRAVTAIKLTTGAGTQTISDCQSSTVNPPLFIDKTAEEFTCAPGETLKATVTSGASWTHLYIYVDEAADGFGYEADEENHKALAGSDLKAWTHYKFGDANNGWNSLGESTGGGVALSEIPSFTAPTKPGLYRMRYKTDWNNIDPKGDLGDGTGAASGSNNIVKNGGAIIDVTLHVLSPQQGAYNNLLAQAQADLDFAKSTESGERWNTLVTDPANISSPKTQAGEGSIAALLDGNLSTYWHSEWSGGSVASDNSLHYLQFDLGEAYSNLQMQYQRRQGVGADHPTKFLITASNDGETFEEIKEINVTGDADNVRHTWDLENETAYRYVRVRATMTDQWRGYWHAAEMNFYHYEFVKGADLYTKAGEIATQIEAILANPATSPTQEDVDALQALCDQLHALIHDIDQYRGYPGKLNMYGGYKATEEQVAALAEAIENYDAAAAKAVVDALTEVDNARTAFTLVTERASIFAAEKEDGSYLLVGGNNKLGLTLEEGSDLGKWAFVDFDGGKYLYNVGAKLFANDNLTMTATPTANAISVTESGNAAYPFMVKSGDNYFNVSNPGGGYNEGLVINNWSNKDGGNQFQIAVAADFDPAVAVTVLVNAAAQADMDRLEALWADLTQFIAGKEEYITADVRQAIETIMGDSWSTAINGAYLDAVEAGTAYVSPDIWDTLDTQIAWVKEQIEKVMNGEIALYTENGVVGDGTINTAMPFFNTEAQVEVYTDHITIKAWDGVEGSDLTVAFAGIQVNEETQTVITGIEQKVNGEVVSTLFDDTNEEDEEAEPSRIVILQPQSTYSQAFIMIDEEQTNITIGETSGTLSLAGLWTKATAEEGEEESEGDNMGVDNISAAYMFTWPGTAVEINPVDPAELTLSYVLNEGKTQATVTVEGLVEAEGSTTVYFLNDNEDADGMLENGNTFEVAPTNAPETIKVTVRQYDATMENVLAQGTIKIDFPAPVEPATFTRGDVIDADNVAGLTEGCVLGFMYGQIGFAGKAWLNADQTPVVTEEEEVLPELGKAGSYALEAASEGYFYLRDLKQAKYISRSAGKSTEGDQCDIVMVEDKADAAEFQIVPTTANNANVYKGETTKTSQLVAKTMDSWTEATNYNVIKLGGNTGVAANWGLGGNGPWKLWRVYYLGDVQDVPDAVNSVNVETNSSVYNLNGQRVNKAMKGLYIINGKKVVVK